MQASAGGRSPLLTIGFSKLFRIRATGLMYSWNTAFMMAPSGPMAASNGSSGKCAYSRTFRWTSSSASDVCEAHFICTALDGNPCQDYGFELSHIRYSAGQTKADARPRSACKTGYLFRKWIAAQDHVEVKLWRTQAANFNTTCFFWCLKATQSANLIRYAVSYM